MRVAYIDNAFPQSGIGTRAMEIRHRLEQYSEVDIDTYTLEGEQHTLRKNDQIVRRRKYFPPLTRSKSVSWVVLGRSIPTSGYDLYDCTNQTLSFLSKRRSPCILTVHDIIEVTEPQDKRAYLINRYLYSGIVRSDAIIAVSNYTKDMLTKHYGISDTTISVIPNGVSNVFKLVDQFENTIGHHELRRNLKIVDSYPIVLYVGSEHPRKNLNTLVWAFKLIQTRRPDAILVKVGSPGLLNGRKAFLDAIDRAGITNAVRFVPTVTNHQLNDLYNLADVFVYPSLFEGFGMPPLQAMAAGTPVVCSNATSLPEVVGDAAVLCNPHDVNAFDGAITMVLEDERMRNSLIAKGLTRCKQFSWDHAAARVREVYRSCVAI